METPCHNTVTIRRNPHRKARATPSTNAIPSSSSSNLPEIPSFPIHEILSIQVPEPAKPPISESLKVYLRIRPLKSFTKSLTNKHRNVWPQNPTKKNNAKENNVKKKKSNEVCLKVNDSHSVTLSTPPAFQDSKRSKSEVYEGFSHVFNTDSSQNEVYETMVSHLVEDFLKGKSGMLAALGPSGSGKTHTVFGCPREPGMVPLAVKNIFKPTQESSPGFSRSFHMSIFEIYSERGKGERLCDLLPDGTDLWMQQSTIKGLQEVLINDVEQAESLIARSMLKRATAMTNSNSQSSRSQCIINIRAVTNGSGQETHVQSNNAVLTIVDLAGAEREKRTGNQGARLLESNFINNTSMVFGLCLRSLLDRQKNPKKALEKHFQNSLLTRYLRDYLEGKKRMTLILTVKPGEEDFLDTSYLLKQASPYMKIKFDNVEELSNKRNFQTFPRAEQNKRMKFSGLGACEIEGKSIGDIHRLSEKESSKLSKVENNDSASPKMDSVDWIKSKRNHMIMQNFAKALWSILKQYNEKLKVAEGEVQMLREDLSNERTRSLELENQLSDQKSCCTCSKKNLVEASLSKVDTSFEAREQFEGHICCVDETNLDAHSPKVKEPQCSSTPGGCDSTPGQSQDVFPHAQTNVVVRSPNQKSSDCYSTLEVCDSPRQHKICESSPGSGNSNKDSNDSNYMGIEDNHPNSDVAEFVVSSSQSRAMVSDDSCSSVELAQQPTEKDEAPEPQCNSTPEGCDSTPGQGQDVFPRAQTNVVVRSPNQKSSDCYSTLEVCDSPRQHKICESSLRCGNSNRDSNDSNYMGIKDNHPNSDVAEFVVSSSQSRAMVSDDSCSSVELAQQPSEKDEGTPDLQLSPKDVTFSQGCNFHVPDIQPKLDSPDKPLNMDKPKRRLLPASSILVRDISILDIENDFEKPKGNKGGKKLAADGRQRTQGSISLLHLLKSNLHL